MVDLTQLLLSRLLIAQQASLIFPEAPNKRLTIKKNVNVGYNLYAGYGTDNPNCLCAGKDLIKAA